MRAQEFICEEIVSNVQVGRYRVAIDSHLLDRQDRPGFDPIETETVMQTVNKLPSAKAKIKTLDRGQKFWLHDNTNNISVGFKILDDERTAFLAKTVLPARSNTSLYPTFEVR